MANGKRHSVVVSKITCLGTSEFGGMNDEVVLIYQADAGPPVRFPMEQKYQQMNTAANTGNEVVSTWETNLTLDFDHEVLVTLWDHDSPIPSTSEFLVNVNYRPGNVPSSYTMSNHNSAKYTIYASAID